MSSYFCDEDAYVYLICSRKMKNVVLTDWTLMTLQLELDVASNFGACLALLRLFLVFVVVLLLNRLFCDENETNPMELAEDL